jgi:hypothetical protein
VEIDAAVVELYGLPPEQFVAARNQLAKAVRDRGEEPAAAAIGALRSPRSLPGSLTSLYGPTPTVFMT